MLVYCASLALYVLQETETMTAKAERDLVREIESVSKRLMLLLLDTTRFVACSCAHSDVLSRVTRLPRGLVRLRGRHYGVR
jgi:hypothetical protein